MDFDERIARLLGEAMVEGTDVPAGGCRYAWLLGHLMLGQDQETREEVLEWVNR